MDVKQQTRAAVSYADALALLQETTAAAPQEPEEAEHSLALGHMTVDFKRHKVQVCQKTVPLTYIEWLLLRELANDAGRMVPHQELMIRVWGPRANRQVHLLHMWMSRLRNKLEDHGSEAELIRTVHGVGYLIEIPEDRPRKRASPKTGR